MQIDFHHAVTYVVARLSGFKQEKAEIIAHAAQYVDDAISSGTVHFSNNAMYTLTLGLTKNLQAFCMTLTKLKML